MNDSIGLWTFLLVVWWMLGVAVAKGFWLIVGAAVFPPLAWVIFAQWALGI